MTHIKAPTLFSRGILIFQGVLTKFNFLTKFPHLKKNCPFNERLKKYEHQSIFPLWGRVKLNFRDRYRKPHIYSKNSSRYQFFSSNSLKMTLWCKKLPLPTQMHLYSSYMVPHMIPWGNYNRPRSTNKIQFLMKFPHLEKNY